MKTNWKAIAIIFIVLFSLLLLFDIFAISIYNKDLRKENICFYDICSGYPDAYYLNQVCECYDYDVIGNLVISKSEYMGKK